MRHQKPAPETFIESVFGKIRRVRDTGVARSMRIQIDRLFLAGLRQIYGFGPWHVNAPLSARPYRYLVAEMANSLDPVCVVEIGCGLGSILGLVRAPERYGYDVDDGVVRAARVLRGRKVIFAKGGMDDVSVPYIDVLILVNWIHEVSAEQLQRWLEGLLPRTEYLLLDAIDPDGQDGYRFKHDFAFLETKAERVSERRVPNEGRSFVLYRVSGKTLTPLSRVPK